MSYDQRYQVWFGGLPPAKSSILNVYSRIVDQPVFTSQSHPQVTAQLEAVHLMVDSGGENLAITPLLEACSALPPHNAVCLLDSLRAHDEDTFKDAYSELGDEETKSLDGLLKSFLMMENIMHTLSPSALSLVKQHASKPSIAVDPAPSDFPGL